MVHHQLIGWTSKGEDVRSGKELLRAAEVLSKSGYFKQTEQQRQDKFNKEFELDEKGERRKFLRDYWISNVATKEQGVEAERQKFYGHFQTNYKKDFHDDEYTRIRFSNKMGFPKKH